MSIPLSMRLYEQQIFKVDTPHHTYSEEQIKEEILRSVKGSAAVVFRSVGLKADLDKVLRRLESVYGTVTNSDVLLQNFYYLVQNKSEKVQGFANRLEESLVTYDSHSISL